MDQNKELIVLLKKPKLSINDKKQIIMNIREHNLKQPDLIINFGIDLIKNKDKLGNQYFVIVEQIFYAALECQLYKLSDISLNILLKQFSDSTKITRMKGIMKEAFGQIESSERYYRHLIDNNLMDFDTKKRYIGLFRMKGEKREAIKEINTYLAVNPLDTEAWLELADIYLKDLNYKYGLHCYEEIILQFPKNIHYLMKVAELNYTLKEFENAKKYYSLILIKSPSNIRALWGLIYTCKQFKNDASCKEIILVCEQTLNKIYKENQLGKLIKNVLQ